MRVSLIAVLVICSTAGGNAFSIPLGPRQARPRVGIGVRTPAGDLINVADNQDDNTAYLEDTVSKAAALPGDGPRVVDLGGRTYGISQPLVLPTGLRLANFKLVALPSGAWTADNAVVQTATNSYNTAVENGYIDCGSVAYNGFQNNGSGFVSFSGLRITHFLRKGFDIEGSVTGSNSEASQWLPGDAEYNDQAKRTAYALYIGPKGTDSIFSNVTLDVAKAPVFITGAHNIRFIGLHPWNGSTNGRPHSDPLLMDIEGGAFEITCVGCYLDTGYILYEITKFTSAFLQITGSFGFYNASAATYPAWIRLTTSQPKSSLSGLRLAGNRWPGGTPVVQLETTGAGSWTVSNEALTGKDQDFAFERMERPTVLKGPAYRFKQSDDEHTFLVGIDGRRQSIAIPNSMAWPFDVTLVTPGGVQASVHAEPGAQLNGVPGGEVELRPNQAVRLICPQNESGAAADCYIK